MTDKYAQYEDGISESPCYCTRHGQIPHCGYNAPKVPELQRELAFYFEAHHGTISHRGDAASCMENECVRLRNLLK